MAEPRRELTSDDEDLCTQEEQLAAIGEIREWADGLGEDDYHPMIILDMVGKKFTLQEFIEDAEAGTALGQALLDVIIENAKKEGLTPVAYTKKMMKTASGEVVRGKFWLESGHK